MMKGNHYLTKLLLRLFRWFCHPDYVEDIEGDLLERFERNSRAGQAKSWLFTLEVLKLFRPSLMRKIGGSYRLNQYGVLNTMLKIAWRNALRKKQFTVLNLLGLTLGIATFLVISLYVFHETSYDRFHEKGERIYRVNQPNIWGDWDEWASSTGPNVAEALRTEVPEFEEVTRILSLGAQTVHLGSQEGRNTTLIERAFYAAEDNFFDVFSFEFLAGDHTTVFNEPNIMVLTLETAHRYFDENTSLSDLIGKSVEVKNWDGSWETFLVGGIVKDVPDRSHLQFDILVSLSSYQDQMDRDGWKWIWTGFSTYVLVHEAADLAALKEKIQTIPPKWAAPTTERIFNQTFEAFTAGHPWRLDLQPLDEIYSSGSPEEQRFGPTGNPLFVKIFGAVGVLVLALSAINFMNMSTARSSCRAKEVGIRKVLGTERAALLGQFILESMLFVLFGTLIALCVVHFSLGWFNGVTDTEMDLGVLLANPLAIGMLIVFVVILGLASGSYPAFYLSSFAPTRVLKSMSAQGIEGKGLRNALVVFQFTISIALIICASFIQKQLSYGSSLDLGFEKENILQIHNIEQYGFDTEKIKAQLQSNSAFSSVGKSFGIPPNISSGDRYRAAGGNTEVIQFNNLRAEGDYLQLLGLEFLDGRNFDSSKPNDHYKVIINEAASKELGWGDASFYHEHSPVGKKIAIASGDEDQFEVIGVVKDFHYNSLKLAIGPIIIIHTDNDHVWDYGAGRSFYSLKLNPEVVKNTEDLTLLLQQVEDQLAEIDATVPFEFSFMDQDFENTFRFEQKMGGVLNVFTLMALLIACLGLFGLAAFSAEQRTKELGIRKVLGASISSLVLSFSSEFIKLVLIAILIACPIAWLLVHEWLSGFAYRTPIEPWIFAVASVISLIVAFGTIGFQSLKTAHLNPVETLKDE